METLAANVTHFFLQKHYIEPTRPNGFQYGLASRMMGCLTFLLLLPAGAPFCRLDQFIPLPVHLSFFANADGRLPRQNAARLPAGLAWHHVRGVDLAKNLHSPLLIGAVLFAAALCIFVLAPANNASLHLTANEIAAIRPRVRLRLAGAVLMGCLLLYICAPLASCIAASLLAVAVMLVLTNSGLGAQ